MRWTRIPFPPLGVRFCRPPVPKEFKILGSRCLDVFSSRPTSVPLPSRRPEASRRPGWPAFSKATRCCGERVTPRVRKLVPYLGLPRQLASVANAFTKSFNTYPLVWWPFSRTLRELTPKCFNWCANQLPVIGLLPGHVSSQGRSAKPHSASTSCLDAIRVAPVFVKTWRMSERRLKAEG